jgi:tetratricopeptide (TPR) repeat protein
MSSDRIAELHEQASEHYLNGDYGGALQAWRDVLALDPKNEQALDGVRMAAQYVERVEAPAAPTELDHELDAGLTILDSLGAPPTAAAPAPRLDPSATMILDRSAIQGLIDMKPRPAEATGWEAPAAAEEPTFELEPVTTPASSVAAAAELKRRVDDLLSQAQAKADAGERDEALAILGRLAILDEENADAAVLRTALESSGRSDLDAVEQAITEGVQAIESDHLDDAERCFNQVLEKSPGHREALHYLETIGKRRAEASGAAQHPVAGMHEDLLAGGDMLMDFPPADPSGPFPAPAAHGTPSSAPPVERAAKAAAPKAPRVTPLPEPPVAPSTRRMTFPSARVLGMAGGAVVLAALAVVLVPRLLAGRGTHAASTATTTAAGPRPAAKPHPAPPAPPAKAATPSVAPATQEDRATAVAADIAKGKRQMDSGDVPAALISFNEALKLDPVNPDAKSGLNDAVEKYKARKAELDAMDGIKMAFRDQEYTSALRLAYRLPPTISGDVVARVKVAGWYDLGIVALRAGECREAIGHFEEALAIDGTDAEAKKLHEFAKAYVDAPRDRKFLDFVEALQFRPPAI